MRAVRLHAERVPVLCVSDASVLTGGAPLDHGPAGRTSRRGSFRSPLTGHSIALMPGRLLVVEDDPELRDVIVMALEQEGYVVRCAENGVEAMVLLYLADAPPDAVVLNLHMPVMSGAELVDVVRHDPRLAATPLVLMTGGSVPPDLGRAVDAVLEKPFGLDELAGAVGGLLARGGRSAPAPSPP